MRQVVELKPDFIDARHTLAEILQAQGQWEQAIQQFQAILPHKPAIINYRMGQLYLKQWSVNRQKKDFRQAKEYFNQALKLNPKNVGARNSLEQIQNLLAEEHKTSTPE